MASSTTESIAARLPLADYDRLDALRMTMSPPTWRRTLEWLIHHPSVQVAVTSHLGVHPAPNIGANTDLQHAFDTLGWLRSQSISDSDHDDIVAVQAILKEAMEP